MVHLTDLADAARKSGLHVVEIHGWKTRGRPASTGGFNPRGILVHHTGSNPPDSRAYVDWLFLTGRSDLPAPLCQIALGRDGTVYVGAAGRANHAGTAQASGPVPAGDGNALYIGIEALNNGTEGWSAAQYDAYVRLCRALVDHYGWTPAHVRAHKETSASGKWDPGQLDMDNLRSAIAHQPQEDDVSAEEVWNHPVATDAGDVPAKIALRRSLSQSTRGRLAAEAAMSGVGDLAKLIKTMPGAGDDLKKLADDIVTRTAAAVKRLDAESVAQQLEVKPKGQ